MDHEQIVRILRTRWRAEGVCVSCGWRAPISAYGDLARAMRVDEKSSAVQLPCLSADGARHLGVRLRFGRAPARRSFVEVERNWLPR